MKFRLPTLKRLAGDTGLESPFAWLPNFCAVGSIFLLGGCQLADVAQFSYANATATHQWVGDARSTTLHFDLIDDHIVLPVRINDSEPLNFVLDSGAAATVILESRGTRTLPLEMAGEVPVSGVGNGPDPRAFFVKDADLSIGSVRLEGLSAVYLPLSSVPFFENLDEVYFDGVIGAPFFERFAIAIDYDRQLISFSESGDVAGRPHRGSQGWQELPLQVESGLPYLVTQIGIGPDQSAEVKLLVDTGYRGPVSLTPDTHSEIAAPLEYFSSVSQGLSGDVQSRVTMSEYLKVGDFQLEGLPVSYSISGGESDDGSNGLLGNEALSRFNLVFDYPNKRLFVKPNERFAEPISADRSGLLIRPHAQGAVVKSIASDSAGARLELRVADIIASIDDEPVTYANISKLKRVLASDREIVPICWLSGDQPRCGELALASRFDQREGR